MSGDSATVVDQRFGDGTGLCRSDGLLHAHAHALRARQQRFLARLSELEAGGGLLGAVSLGHRYFGFNRAERDGVAGVFYREWAPAARALYLTGDFNGWDRASHPLTRDEYGVWSVFVPAQGGAALAHGGRIKVHVVTAHGAQDRVPAYVTRALQDPVSHDFSGQFWDPPVPYVFRHAAPSASPTPRIYEAHVGMALEEARLGSYGEFTRSVLPHIAALGYDTLQLMAVMEHPYYGSFGYHVSSFFAASSRFGTPEELKELIDTAHGLGMRVLLDLVHSHAVRNTQEGLNLLDGTEHQYFHALPRGLHAAWDSMVFDYSKFEVLRFLLSNVRYWLEEFRFDGFRFDGVTSMLYLDHGLARSFSSYDDYFGANVDEDAVTYVKLANLLAHSLPKRDVITIAEDVSGMPGMARKLEEGGLGFDFRLAMGVPDYWIKVVKEWRDEAWRMDELFGAMLNRRHDEKHVAYAESHDQALVGDQTLAFRLMGAEMYFKMGKGDHSAVVERGLALHKMIRLFTLALAGDAWLNFMGNELGHPDWVDFPREGNGWSYQYARRQWSLAAREDLRYGGLLRFDRALLLLDKSERLLEAKLIEQLLVHEDDKLLVFRRGPLVFAFNFHPTRSYEGRFIPVPDACDYVHVLDSDAGAFEGFGRIAEGQKYVYKNAPIAGRAQSVQIYLPSRTALVIKPDQ
jgi:1,4-alpha-glucan branching enzyme